MRAFARPSCPLLARTVSRLVAFGVAPHAHSTSAQVVAMHKDNGSTVWLQRPLPPQLLAYAAHDIELIAMLYGHFKTIGWITPSNEPTLIAQSMRYAYSLSHQGRVAEDDVFGSSAVLPLDVLTEPRGLTFPCHGCRRMQSLHSFTVRKQNRKPISRTNICRVCQIKLLIKEKKYPVSWLGVSIECWTCVSHMAEPALDRIPDVRWCSTSMSLFPSLYSTQCIVYTL